MMNKILLFLVAILWVLVIVRSVFTQFKERFSIQSIPIDLPTKYPLAYYAEMDNASFEKALKATFASPETCKATEVALKQEEWITIPSTEPMGMGHIFETQILPLMEKTIRESPHFQEVNGQLQIAYEKRVHMYRHVSKKDVYLTLVEFLLYREGKYQGKHVEVGMLLENHQGTWNYQVVTARVVGIVFEDRFAMFPVEARNPFDAAQMDFNENPYVQQPSILMSNEDVIQAVQKQADANVRWVESQIAIAPK